MRFTFSILASFFLFGVSAQTPMPVTEMNYSRWQSFPSYPGASGSDSNANQKWYFSKYAGLAVGFGFFNGGSSTTMSLPLGLRLNHPLNDNLVAFAGISAAPTLFYVHSLTDPLLYKPSQVPYLSNTYNFGMNSRVELGLMYTNDAKTFSISGSIGVDRYAYPVYPSERTNLKKP
jgi:hypothetical protein